MNAAHAPRSGAAIVWQTALVPRDQLADLIATGRLKPGTVLHHRGRQAGRRHLTATVVEGGIRYAGRVYRTPSAAARVITNAPVAGWQFWRLTSGKPLASIRPD